jgi:hypothetical protein
MLYTRPSSFIGNNIPDKKGLNHRKPTEFISAIRYGQSIEGEAIFEMYLGTVVNLPDGPLLIMNEKRSYALSSFLSDVADIQFEVSPGWTGTLADINELITRDALGNKASRCKLLWWIDIAMVKVAAHHVDKYVAALGLPNDSKFRSVFGQFGACLAQDEKSHVYAGNGNSHLGGVSSLTFFVQALWLLSVPVVHNLPSWAERALYTLPDFISAPLKRYYNSRFSFLFRASSLSKTQHEEYSASYENAQQIANVSFFSVFSQPAPLLLFINALLSVHRG